MLYQECCCHMKYRERKKQYILRTVYWPIHKWSAHEWIILVLQWDMWTDEHTQGGRSVHTAASEPGTVLQRAVHHLPDPRGAGTPCSLYVKEEGQDWSQVHQVDTKGLEQAGQVVDWGHCCCILVLYMNHVCGMNLWTIYLAIFITGRFDCLGLFVLISNYLDLYPLWNVPQS